MISCSKIFSKIPRRFIFLMQNILDDFKSFKLYITLIIIIVIHEKKKKNERYA